MLMVRGQRENVKLESNQREGVGICASCGAGFYASITRTRDPVATPEEMERRKNRNS